MLLEYLSWHREGNRKEILAERITWQRSSAAKLAETWTELGQVSWNPTTNYFCCATIITKWSFSAWVYGWANTSCWNRMIAAFEVIFSCFVFIFDVERGYHFSLSWKQRLRRRKSLALYDTKRKKWELGLMFGPRLVVKLSRFVDAGGDFRVVARLSRDE